MKILSLPRSSGMVFLLVCLCLFYPGILSSPAQARNPREVSSGPPYKVKTVTGIRYREGKDADQVRHQLDLYLPEGVSEFPVVFFVHGGAWRRGDKNQLGIYALLGASLARNGIGMVSTNYRLSPQVKHPDHIKDVAHAFAWTKRNIGKYGGREDELFVCGHSAGGHLVALLASDERWLKAEGLTMADIRGAIPMSGVYQLVNHVAFTGVFGEDKNVLRQASPIQQVKPGLPPYLIIFAETELPGCDGPIARTFHAALAKQNIPARLMEVDRRNHITIILNAGQEKDPVNQAIREFVMINVFAHRLVQGGSQGLEMLQGFLRNQQ